MPRHTLTYAHLPPDAALPAVEHLPPFIAIVLIEDEVPQTWQWEVCRWLAASSCRYVLVWGEQCGEWEDAIDEARLEACDYGDIAEEDLVLTTSHEDENWEEVFWYAKHRTSHPAHVLGAILVLHIAQTEKREEITQLYATA
jgi:hypothetical protein